MYTIFITVINITVEFSLNVICCSRSVGKCGPKGFSELLVYLPRKCSFQALTLSQTSETSRLRALMAELATERERNGKGLWVMEVPGEVGKNSWQREPRLMVPWRCCRSQHLGVPLPSPQPQQDPVFWCGRLGVWFRRGPRAWKSREQGWTQMLEMLIPLKGGRGAHDSPEAQAINFLGQEEELTSLTAV